MKFEKKPFGVWSAEWSAEQKADKGPRESVAGGHNLRYKYKNNPSNKLYMQKTLIMNVNIIEKP